MPSLLSKAEDSLIHLRFRLRIVAVREFVRLLAGLPIRMKYCSVCVHLRSVGKEQRKVSWTERFGRGFSRHNLARFRSFYLLFPPAEIRATLSLKSREDHSQTKQATLSSKSLIPSVADAEKSAIGPVFSDDKSEPVGAVFEFYGVELFVLMDRDMRKLIKETQTGEVLHTSYRPSVINITARTHKTSIELQWKVWQPKETVGYHPYPYE